MSTNEFDKILDDAVTANEAQNFTNFDDKLANLKKIVISLAEAKEKELCEQEIASVEQKDLLPIEIKVRINAVKAKAKFYKKFYGQLKAMKCAYDKMKRKAKIGINEFDNILDDAVTANEAQDFTNFDDKLANLKKIVVSLAEAKEKELCEQEIASVRHKDLLVKEIKVRLDAAKAKAKFHKKFCGQLKAMKCAYDKMKQ